ncbi:MULTISPECIES: hypothetical protein [Fictibacillus]|uniref:Uncharacterized protein n=1 Tax=Fictibacillus terranigra TaxID=3058424 RepID=A0ABT8E6S8_9BACL|nr:hypothetical protein [Fictibacillus sp. CENA-BCM004]MDN4073600.1 hypothetical protein [Fictibacillus sp. CENA-BCM004]
MKWFLFIIPVHCVLWTGYFTVIQLSRHDRVFFEVVLFLMFLYLSYLLSHTLCQKRTMALKSTILSTALFLLAKWTMLLFGTFNPL